MIGYLENKMQRLSRGAFTKSLGILSWWLPGGPEDNSVWLEYSVGHRDSNCAPHIQDSNILVSYNLDLQM
jgi:hypothetical protein